VEDWRKVIWSDESKFMIWNSDGREWCWRDPKLPMTSQHVKPTVKYGKDSVMLWGCFSYFGVGLCCKIDGRMNGELYREILADELMRTMSMHDLGISCHLSA